MFADVLRGVPGAPEEGNGGQTMTRKRARKILMSIGTSRNHANWGLTAKPRWKTNAGVVEDTLTIKLYAKLLRARRMATKRVCDRCGAEINPTSSATYVNVRSAFHEKSPDIELCCSCAMQLRKWMEPRAEEGEKDG